MKNYSLIENFSVHIATLAENKDGQAFMHHVYVPTEIVKDIDYVECQLDYPLNRIVKVRIKLQKWNGGEKTLIDVDHLATEIVCKYKWLWEKHENWFWGHHWGDLYIEGLELRGNVLDVFVGS